MKLLITTQTVDIDDPILGFFHGWINEFAKHFERIDVICLREGKHKLPPNVFVHSLGKEEGENRFKYVWRFYKIFTRVYYSGVNFVFFHMGAVYNILAAPFFLVRNLKQTKFYWWKTHGKVGQLKERLALIFCDSVFTAGAYSFDLHTKKACVVGHAINTDVFNFDSTVPIQLSQVLVVGRIVPIKKIEVAVASFAHSDFGNKGQLSIIGSGDNATYRSFLESEIANTGKLNIHFVGTRTQRELVEEYHKAQVLIHPAYEAGFDKVVLEAMACGVIPITSIQSFKYILNPFGLFVPPNSVQGFVEVLDRIMDMTESEQRDLKKNLREIVVRNHALSSLPKRIFGV